MTQQVQSSKTLAKATIFAVILAVVVLISVILPAEYNIDPTGIGHSLGLTVLAPKAELTKEQPLAYQQVAQQVINENTATITIEPNRGVEYKFYLTTAQKLKYQWQTDGQAIYFDLHGEPEGDTTGFFESYTIATSNEMSGTLTTPFAGSHGWYWKNTSDKPVVITLTTSGNYKIIGLK